MSENIFRYKVGLHAIKQRDHQIFILHICKWVTGFAKVGPRSGRPSVATSTDPSKAFTFTKESADAMANRLKSWGYYPEVLEVK